MSLCETCARDGAHAIGRHYVGAPAPCASCSPNTLASFIPGIVSSDDANAKRHELGVAVTSVEEDISQGAGAKLPSNIRQQWEAWGTGSFVPWFNKCQGFIGAAADLQKGLQLQGELRNFQIQISKYVPLTLPIVADPSAPAPGSIGAIGAAAASSLGTAASRLGTLAWVVGIGALAGGLWLGYRALAAERAMKELAPKLAPLAMA
ncbi:MAG: hypothetical protein ACYCPT_02035 [Acidimicrobiales bacterium]